MLNSSRSPLRSASPDNLPVPPPSAQTRCSLVKPSQRGAKRWWELSFRGKRGRERMREREVFPLRASCYYSASGAEQWEMSVLCLWDRTQNTAYSRPRRLTRVPLKDGHIDEWKQGKGRRIKTSGRTWGRPINDDLFLKGGNWSWHSGLSGRSV